MVAGDIVLVNLGHAGERALDISHRVPLPNPSEDVEGPTVHSNTPVLDAPGSVPAGNANILALLPILSWTGKFRSLL